MKAERLKIREKFPTLWNWFVFSMIEEKIAKEVQLVPLSNNTIYKVMQDCVANKLYELF